MNQWNDNEENVIACSQCLSQRELNIKYVHAMNYFIYICLSKNRLNFLLFVTSTVCRTNFTAILIANINILGFILNLTRLLYKLYCENMDQTSEPVRKPSLRRVSVSDTHLPKLDAALQSPPLGPARNRGM